MTDERPVTMTNPGKSISSTVTDPAGKRSLTILLAALSLFSLASIRRVL